ncbi:shikimate kinase [Hydrogenimonas urashimensis]|uniref:shikimate kinase n=1 Tax=Hydrogenimonas urashimensis TaxID=2740515 RepID=UPI001F474456|nr:shikimate kinase [Hydrogenimonas urashimensis]
MRCAENIVLIGFMGAGKSTVGRRLAQRSGRYFLDADALIESAQGKAIPSIFDEKGEAYFRQLEQQSARWLAECVRGSIVSTGGGMPMVVEKLRDIGTVVYLKISFEKILQRIRPEERKKRPLFNDTAKTRMLFEARERIYEKRAQITVDADRDPDAIVEEILSKIEEKQNA